jgi:predicted O-methyltransferase YrrM
MRTFPDLGALKLAAAKDHGLMTRVQRSEEWGDGWGTNVPLLAAAVAASTGPVLEIGGGLFSTPVLAAMCKATNRELITLDNDENWIKSYADVQKNAHCLPQWDEQELERFKAQYGVIFVDHRPDDARLPVLQAIRAWNPDYIVCHDTCNPYFTGVDAFLNTFAWRYDWGFMASSTTVVSDTKEFPVIHETY